MFTFKTSTEAKKNLFSIHNKSSASWSFPPIILWKQKDKAYLYKALKITTSFQQVKTQVKNEGITSYELLVTNDSDKHSGYRKFISACKLPGC